MQIDLKIWLDHFEYHAGHRRALPERGRERLTPQERSRIASSIATFQLGEQSEGRSLLRSARRYALAHDTPSIARIVELLIAEEQHHAALLGAFMDQHDLPRKRSDWTDNVFRCVRRLAGLELQFSVLITAELIGKVYYRALESASGCRQLQALCHAIVADELAHVGFESDVLLAMRARKFPSTRHAVGVAHRAFLACAALVVWLTHGAVLRAAGYRMQGFLRACDAQYSFYFTASGNAATPGPEPCSRGAPGNTAPPITRSKAMITLLFLTSLAATIALLVAVAADEGVTSAFRA